MGSLVAIRRYLTSRHQRRGEPGRNRGFGVSGIANADQRILNPQDSAKMHAEEGSWVFYTDVPDVT